MRHRLRREHGPLDAEPLDLSINLDRAAVAGAVAQAIGASQASWAAGSSFATAASIGSGPQASTSWPGESASVTKGRLDHDFRVRNELRRLGVPVTAEARIAGGWPSASERYGSGATPIPPPTSSGRSTSRR